MELEIIRFLQANSNNFLNIFFTIISYIASVYGFIFFSLIIFVFIDRIFALFFAGTYGIAVSINYILKALIDRPRPFQVDNTIINLLPTIGKSMPSGHMVSVTIICIFLGYLIWKKCNSNTIKISATISLACLTILTGISRMYLGQHFVSDLMVGYILASAIGIFGLFIYQKRKSIYEYFKNNREKRKKRNSDQN